MSLLDVQAAPQARVAALEYPRAYKHTQRWQAAASLLVTLGSIAYAAALSYHDVLTPGSACQLMLALGGFALVCVYRLFDLHIRRVLVCDDGLVFQQPLRSPQLLSWADIGLITGNRLSGTVAVHRRDGSVWPLPAPVTGLGRLWVALETHVPEVVDTGAWEALLRLEKGATARPPLGLTLLPDPVTLAPPAPRPVASTTSLWFNRCLLGGFLVMFLALVVSINADRRRYRLLAEQGQQTMGTVTDWRSGFYNGVTTYEVSYSFAVDGIGYTGVSYVPSRLFQSEPVGGPCLVTYLPDEPGLNCQGFAEERFLEQFLATTLAVALLLPILVFAVLRLEHSAGLERRLLREGGIAAAQVIACDKPKGLVAGKRLVRYRFETADGEMLIAEAKLIQAATVFPGDVVPVVYDPRQPRRNLPLASCGLARIEDKPRVRLDPCMAELASSLA
jgi:hypothetical protein